jgi:hypothetical protein
VDVYPAKSDDGDDYIPERDPGNLPAFYRAKADQCLRYAEGAIDSKARDEWIELANGWLHLARQSQR